MPPSAILASDFDWMRDVITDISEALTQSGFHHTPIALEACLDTLRWEVAKLADYDSRRQQFLS